MNRSDRALKSRLDALLADLDPAAKIHDDPVGLVRAYEDPDDREVVALLASSLAFGNVTSIRRSIARVLEALDGPPAQAIAMGKPKLLRRLAGFKHRVYRGEHVATLLHRASLVRRQHGTLGAAFASLQFHGTQEALARFGDALRGPNVDRGLAHLVPNARAGSACKRLWLWLRWMIRPDDGIDLGQWPLAPASLLIPVDTHVQRIAFNLGLTERRDASWKTAESITASLRRFDAADPVKYDFAICHLGVSKACPSARNDDACGRCVMQPVCRHWT